MLLQITCGCSTDGPDCESCRKYEGQDAELGQAARTHLGSGYLLGTRDPANLANRTGLHNIHIMSHYLHFFLKSVILQ